MSKLNQFVIIQHVAINNHGISFTTQQASLKNYGPTAIHRSPEDGCFITKTGSRRQTMEVK
jgi:hypothetical protein